MFLSSMSFALFAFHLAFRWLFVLALENVLSNKLG